MKNPPCRPDKKSAKAIERSRSGRNGLNADEGEAVEQSSKIQPHSWSDLVQDEDLNNEYQEYDLSECPWMQDAVMEKDKVILPQPKEASKSADRTDPQAIAGKFSQSCSCFSALLFRHQLKERAAWADFPCWLDNINAVLTVS
ncbi:hypothetical protein Dimus_035625 [Dionaea muscipula]